MNKKLSDYEAEKVADFIFDNIIDRSLDKIGRYIAQEMMISSSEFMAMSQEHQKQIVAKAMLGLLDARLRETGNICPHCDEYIEGHGPGHCDNCGAWLDGNGE